MAKFKEGFRQYPQDFDSRDIIRNENVQVQITADMAWVSYDQVTLKTMPGMHIPPYCHEIKILQRFDGEWKIVCLTSIAPGIGRQDVPRIELGKSGIVVEINALAHESLSDHPGLVISGSRLRAKKREFDHKLQAAIEARLRRLATNLPSGFLGEIEDIVALGEDDTGHPMFCWVAAEQERVLVTFDDEFLLDKKLGMSAAAFNLSPAQLKIVRRLALGEDLAGAARTLGISANTAKTQVRRMFEKTGTHTQAALLSILLSAQRQI